MCALVLHSYQLVSTGMGVIAGTRVEYHSGVERLLQDGSQDSGSDEENIQVAASSPVDPVSD